MRLLPPHHLEFAVKFLICWSLGPAVSCCVCRAIITYRTGKRDTGTTQEFMADLRERVLGSPEISTDGYLPYQPAVRTEFQNSAHGVINKTFSVTHLRMDQAHHRYSPAAVIACERESVQGVAEDISTSYVERSNLSIRMGMRRMTRLTNAFSKKWENLWAAYCLWFAYYNFCRVHQTLTQAHPNHYPTTPAMAAGIADHVWPVEETCDLLP